MDDIPKKKKSFRIDFHENPIGEYSIINSSGVIQFYESACLRGNEIESALEKIEEGDYIRVFWWFHQFDKEKFRKNRMCNPPYDNEPKCGIFATRSPVRPNPLAFTVVKAEQVDKYNHFIKVCGFDGFENSKILQIMSYHTVPIFDHVKVPNWVDHWSDYKVFDEPKINIRAMRVKEKIDYVQELELESNLEIEKLETNEIIVEHASIHNPKDICITITKEKIIVFTGVSGSGKSSLAFDTIYNESQKQFIDLIYSNASMINDVNDSKVEKITGLQPVL